ncbi:lysophospholipid acyltransferase family protein [Frigidibacter sp. ROC022]|uniref:lysophospholipid acyltransferase family protein n=1 Tax=Frigidibacter sp. ROC022 TaxID=2971796 RepID=UPI00215A8A38|nr:lysophospholipid acyltransferase family protein [Frigidibacter sp. ROC022]MCR8726310.1 lysophospholipid acyltransferase family protein [Frigidibacter sp. ROC022]
MAGRKPKDSKTQDRSLPRLAVDLAVRGMIGAVRLLPYRARIATMGWLTARVIAPLAGWGKRVRGNLAHTTPDLPEAEIRRLIRRVPDNFGRALMEIYSAPEFIARVRDLTPTGAGVEALREARDSGRPVILVTGHFGNYDAPRAWLIAHGYKVGGLYNPMRNAWFNDHYVAAISGIGTPVFPRSRKGMAEMIRFLKSGGMVGMVIDQYMSHGELLDFLGQPAPTALSAAELALKYDALLVPIYGIRQPDGLGFDIRIEPPIPASDPVTMTQALNDSLTALVRDHMDQWFWIHRRWKPERHQQVTKPGA